MIAELGCNCTLLRSIWLTSNLLWHPALKTGTQSCAGRNNVHPLILFFVKHNSQCNLISFFCRCILKIRGNRQLEIHLGEPHIRLGLIVFISYPLISLCRCVRPPLFLAAQIIDQPPSVWWNRALETQQRRRKFHWFSTKQPHQYCPSHTLFPFPVCLSSLSLQAATVLLVYFI